MRNTCRRLIAAYLVASVHAAAHAAYVFVPEDVLVSDPNLSLKDPEFDLGENRMVWQDSSGTLWLAYVHPDTGAIVPSTGQGQQLATGLAGLFAVGNGPEFGYGAGETFICYTKSVREKHALGVARRGPDGTWTSSVLNEGLNRFRPLATTRGTPDPGRLVYVQEPDSGPNVVSWRVLDDPATERTFTTVGTIGGRWVDTERAFVTVNKIAGVSQVFWVDIDTEVVTQITTESDQKVDAFPWYDPEYGVLIAANINDTQVAIYREIEGVWTRIYSFAIPSEFPFISSPEPLVHNGKSFITVIATQSVGVGPLVHFPSGPGEVWIAGLNPDAPFFRRIDSGENGPKRSEPEPFIIDDDPVVYFTQKDPSTNNATLRLARTGLGSAAAGDTDGDGFSDDADNCAQHANPSQRDTDGDGLGNICDYNPFINNP